MALLTVTWRPVLETICSSLSDRIVDRDASHLANNHSQRTPILILRAPDATGASEPRYLYQIAGHEVWMYQDLPELSSFRQVSAHERMVPETNQPTQRAATTRSIYDGPGWVGNQWRQVALFATEDHYWVTISDVGEFAIQRDGSTIHVYPASPPAAPAIFAESLLGPPLMLALALQHTWCLHASAVAFRDSAILFLGESGNGKSTLARHLSTTMPDVALVADDILPTRLTPTGLSVLPAFPQLKLPADHQPGLQHPAQMPILAVFVTHKETDPAATIQVQPLSAQQAAFALIRHTVAGKLFDAILLERHLAFCTSAVSTFSAQQVRYPHDYAHLPALGNLVYTTFNSLL